LNALTPVVDVLYAGYAIAAKKPLSSSVTVSRAFYFVIQHKATLQKFPHALSLLEAIEIAADAQDVALNKVPGSGIAANARDCEDI